MYKIEWAKRALRQLLKVDLENRNKIVVKVKTLSGWPNCPNIKHLKNHRYQYRLRAGRFRIFFDVENSVKIIKIEEVKKRDERTY
jgi:mRNA-degrading endonuclease RelE of RelBE toxin-antitoxin system